MRKIVLFIILLGFSVGMMACEIKFKQDGDPKKVYAVGDEVIVTLQITLTHRNCSEALESTKYEYPGFKVLGATKWKEVKPMVYERKFKLKVEEPVKGKSKLSAVRTCKKEGGSGVFSINVE